MRLGGDVLEGYDIPLLERGQGGGAFLVLAGHFFFLLLHVDLQIAFELHGAPAGAQDRAAFLVRELDGERIEDSLLHLAGHEAAPDQVVKLGLVGAQELAHFLGPLIGGGRVDSLVGFLRALDLLKVGGRLGRAEIRAVDLGDELGGLFLHVRAHIEGVRAHVSDKTRALAAHIHAFVEALGDLHSAVRRETQLVIGVLLERACDERRLRLLADRLGVHLRNLQRGIAEVRGCFHRILYLLEDGGLVAVVLGEKLQRDRLLHGRGFPAHQLGVEILRIALGQLGVYGVVILFLEGGYFLGALRYQAHGDGLHAPGGKPALDLVPEQRGKLVAHDAVDDAAGLLRVHQRHVQVARALQRFSDGGLGDLMEADALERRVGLYNFPQMPADSLSLAVRVGRQVDDVRVLRDHVQVRDNFLRALH